MEPKKFFLAFALPVLLAGAQTFALAESGGAPVRNNDKSMEEWNAYYHPAPEETSYKDSKSSYMQKLSPGGRIFFLANRKDFAEALFELDKFTRKDTGSELYVRAVCLDGLKKHSASVDYFAEASNRRGLYFQPGPKFFLQYATALFHYHRYEEALSCLDIAERASNLPANKAKTDSNEQQLFSAAILKRKAIIRQLQSGRYNADAQSQMVKDFGMFFSTISMRDVPQLVLQKDVDLHNVSMEAILDSVDYLHNPFSDSLAKKNNAKIPAIDKKMLIAARAQMAQKHYGRCYALLDQFIDANIAEGAMSTEYYIRGYKFADQYLHKVRMLQLGAGYAAGRPNMGLSLRGNFNPDKSEFWSSIENRLLGRDTLVSSKDPAGVRSYNDFVPWCHYAFGVRFLSKKDFNAAAAEFARVGAEGTRDEDLVVYANSLKDFCEKHR